MTTVLDNLRSAERAAVDRMMRYKATTLQSASLLPLFGQWPASTLPLVGNRKGLQHLSGRAIQFTLGQQTQLHNENISHLAATGIVWPELKTNLENPRT